MKGTRERRVTLALKWHYLDNLNPSEIVERFQDEGYDITTASTVRDYLTEQPREEVIEQIEQKHADVRLQIAEREEELYQRAHEAEHEATEDQPLVRVVPKTETVPADNDDPLRWRAWEVVEDPDERPEWATERDVIIRFLDHATSVQPGERYPLRALDGSPKYTKELAGLERDQPDLQGQRIARQEQSQHLEAKGKILGAYEQNINLNADIEAEHSVEFDEETAAAIREATLAQGDSDE